LSKKEAQKLKKGVAILEKGCYNPIVKMFDFWREAQASLFVMKEAKK